MRAEPDKQGHQYSNRIEPEAGKTSFRHETLDRDKTRIIVAIAFVALAIVGFALLDIFFPPAGTSLSASLINRCVTMAACLIAILMIHEQNRSRFFDLIVLLWAIIIMAHLFITHVFRPTETVAVVAWDILAIIFAYIMLLIPLVLQIVPALYQQAFSRDA